MELLQLKELKEEYSYLVEDVNWRIKNDGISVKESVTASMTNFINENRNIITSHEIGQAYIVLHELFLNENK